MAVDYEHRRNYKTLKDFLQERPVKEGISPVHYYNRWMESLEASVKEPEVNIQLPPDLIKAHPRESDEEPETYSPFVVKIEYNIEGNHQGLRFMKELSKDSQSIKYFQVFYSDMEALNRTWMPCIDDQKEKGLWDIEFSVSLSSIDPSLVDKLHAVSTGVLYRQVLEVYFMILNWLFFSFLLKIKRFFILSLMLQFLPAKYHLQLDYLKP